MTTLSYSTILPDSTPKVMRVREVPISPTLAKKISDGLKYGPGAVTRDSRMTYRPNGIVGGMFGTLLVLGLVACAASGTKPAPVRQLPPTTAPTEALNKTEALIATSKSDVKSAGDAADEWWNNTPTDVKEKVGPQRKQVAASLDHADESLTLTAPEYRTVRERIGRLVNERDFAAAEKDRLSKQADTLKSDLAKATSDADAKRAASMTWLMVLGGLLTVTGIVVVSVVPGMLGKAGGTALMLSGPALGAYAVLVDQITRWSWVVVVLAGAAGVLGLIYLGYVLYKNRDAFTRTVRSVKGMQDEVFDVPFVMQAGGVTEAQANLIVEAQWRHAFGDAGIARTIQGAKVTSMVRGILGKSTEAA